MNLAESEQSDRSLLSRETEKALKNERGLNRVATEGFYGLSFIGNWLVLGKFFVNIRVDI